MEPTSTIDSLTITDNYLSNLSKEEVRRLYYLTLRSRSMMKDYVLKRKKHGESIRVFLANLDNKIIGWSCAILPHPNFCIPVKPNAKLSTIYVYIQYKYRKKGIGEKLILAASNFIVEKGLKPVVYGWNRNSLDFFTICQENIPNLVIRDHIALCY